MSHSLKGKAAIITGSTSGIGLGLAQSLAAEGADIMLNGFGDPAEIERLRKGLAATHGVRVGYNNADLSKAAAVNAMIDQAVGELGRVDVLVNNAGIQHTAPVHEFPPERWDAVIAAGNLGYALTARNFNPIMAMSADTVIVTADHIVPVGVIAPDHVATPAPVVDYIVACS